LPLYKSATQRKRNSNSSAGYINTCNIIIDVNLLPFFN